MKIHLTGDSITAAGRDPGDPTDLGDGYVARIAAALPGHEFTNTGLNGHRVPDLQGRWDRDVLADRPDLLSIKLGANDTLLGAGGSGTSTEEYEAGYRELLDRAHAAGVDRIVLVEPFLVPVDDDQQRMLPDLEQKMAAVRRLATEHGALFVPLHEAFTRAITERDPAELVIDGVHPAPAGHQLIARAWLDVVGAEVLDG